MTKETLIQRAYDGFARFKKPRQCTKYTDLEDGEFNALLLSVTRRDLTMEQVGTVAWSPISAMTPEVLAYFMPRLIEFAVFHAVDRDGEPFFCHFIHAFFQGPCGDRFRMFGSEQKTIMADTFRFMVDNYGEALTREGWLEEARRGVEIWSRA